MIATFSPNTSPRVVVSLFAIIAIMTPKRKTPMSTTRHPLNAPRKKTPARDLRGGGATTGSAIASPRAETGSSSVMRSALRRRLRGRSGLGFGFRLGFDGMLRRRRLLVLRDLGVRQRLD